MTDSPPDVWQLVADYLSLLESDYMGRNQRDLSGGQISKVQAAIAQRDRWQLVPKEPTPEIEHAWYNGPTSTHNRFREHWRNALAAIAKSEE